MAEHAHADDSLNPHARGHQEDRINVGAIGVFGVGLVIAVVIVFFVVAYMMVRFRDASRRMEAERPAMLTLDDPASFPGARLQQSPGRAMARMREQVNERLGSYGWVDRQSGVAHIPIERAIEITAEQGLPARSNAEAAGAPE